MNDEIKSLSDSINTLASRIGRPIKLMEVCGTHTVAVFRQGIRAILPKDISLLSGPGCPVCVTSVRDVDNAVRLSMMPGVIMTTFGDMMRVPGSREGKREIPKSLNEAKAEGADIKVLYSPLDALKLAAATPDKKVVFFATGFETTSPLVAATLQSAEQQGIENFYVYTVHKTVPPALEALLMSGDVAVDGFMLPGHVSTIIGTHTYEFLASKHGVPSVVTGFGPEDILHGILMMLKQIHEQKPAVEIQYTKVVKPEGNPTAIATINKYFRPADAYWRGIGTIPGSGLVLRDEYAHRDILNVVHIESGSDEELTEPPGCSCGEVLRGMKIPTDCPLFGKSCTPENPIGACMVSTEGSCAAYYRYGGFTFD